MAIFFPLSEAPLFSVFKPEQKFKHHVTEKDFSFKDKALRFFHKDKKSFAAPLSFPRRRGARVSEGDSTAAWRDEPSSCHAERGINHGKNVKEPDGISHSSQLELMADDYMWCRLLRAEAGQRARCAMECSGAYPRAPSLASRTPSARSQAGACWLPD